MAVSYWTRLLDLISPRLCVVCGERLTVTEQDVCTRCCLHLPRTGFHRQPQENVMARMFWGLIPIERAAALFYYEAAAETSRILYELKYHDHPEVGETMGRLLAREIEGSGFFGGIDMLVPIPLAKKRQRQRGYNQSLMLARGVSEVTAIPIYDQVVRRTVFTETQTRLGRRERQENVENVFELKNPDGIEGKHLLLIDDVVTTGATVTACARELLKVSGVRISVLSLAFTKG